MKNFREAIIARLKIVLKNLTPDFLVLGLQKLTKLFVYISFFVKN
jgi:hypothetical protein